MGKSRHPQASPEMMLQSFREPQTEVEKALAWSERFCALIRRHLALHPDGTDARHWRNWLFMTEQSRRAYRRSNDTEDLLDDYPSGGSAIPNLSRWRRVLREIRTAERDHAVCGALRDQPD